MRLQWRSLFLLSSILYPAVLGKKDAPSVKLTKFDGFVPMNVNYFDDSDVLLFQDTTGHNAYRSEDAGESWKVVDAVPEGKVLWTVMHPLDNKRAYIITNERTHWRTSDRGTTWEKFHTDAQANMFQSAEGLLTFHGGDPDRIIFSGMDCSAAFCEELTMYTIDGFSTDAKFLRSDVISCHWAKSTEIFTTGFEDRDASRILCVAKGRFSERHTDYRLLISDNFFISDNEYEPLLEPGRAVKGIVNMAVVTKYLVVAASAQGTDEMALYVSDDSMIWHRAVFPKDHKLIQEGYTILESTDYSIQVDVMTGNPLTPMGVLFSSNSNGTYFQRNIEHTNRNLWGMVDFEKVSGIQGIALVNTVDNYEEVMKSRKSKKVKSQISFDDGRTFQGLTCDKEELHLHSVTHLTNSGRVFSSPAPGLIMGNGNTGGHLKDYSKGNLYVSDDAGITWRQGLKGPQKYEFGDQGSILVAVADKPTDKIQYSLNHGKDWSSVDIGQEVFPVQLTTTKDSTSLKFLLEAIEHTEDQARPGPPGYIIAIDFDDMHEAQCTSNDMEEWSARVNEDGEPTCLMGHTQSYRRRKPNADCFIKKEFEDPVPETSDCDCTEDDFECDYNFVRSADRMECKLDGNLVIPADSCKGGPDDTFLGSSGWTIIPGNTCKRSSGAQKDDLVEHACKDTAGPHNPSSGKIETTQKMFPGKYFQNTVYLERTDISTGDDETVLIRTDRGVFMSHDHGKNWEQLFDGVAIIAIRRHPYFKDVVYFLTPTEKVYYSTDRGDNIRSFTAPLPPMNDRFGFMSFHWKHKDWIIWRGAKDCHNDADCHAVSAVTTDRGDEWKTLQRYVRRCQFVKEDKKLYLTPPSEIGQKKDEAEKLIYCEVKEKETNSDLDNPWQLVASDDFFDEEPQLQFSNVADFATMSEFIVVATDDRAHKTLHVNASVDGKNFAPAQFPHGFVVPHQTGYTVLDSSTHSVFLHVTVNNEDGLEYGSIIKSNSDGTTYVLSLSGVDRDSAGYVDFEKTLGIEGLAMVNVVANYDSDSYAKEGKLMKTMITHNDGAEWGFVSPPKADADGKKFGCKGDLQGCSLNIHGYTEREVEGHTYSSSSATAFMFGTGSVGKYLTKDADTFMTSDGGVTWKSVKKGKYMWAYGDQGSLLVIVKEGGSTNVLYYSLDEGDSWEEYQFSDDEVQIKDLTTAPSDNSRNFLVWGSSNGDLVATNVDFTGLTNQQCKLDVDDIPGSDYYLWTPRHPNQDDDCLFGHVSQYRRKKPTSNCYNGPMVPSLHDIAKNCTCTRRDFECDFNYERQQDGTCALVAGLDPPDHSLICKADPEQVDYFPPTGYRRIPATTCQGGREMDKSTAEPCVNHEDEFGKKHGASGVAIFFAVVIPFAVATAVGYWVWKNWGSKFGQIRLGEQSASFDSDAPFIKYPVIVIAGVVAVVQATPSLVGSLWRFASSAVGRGSSRRFTTRDSFARGRGDYAIVDEDEGELLGDESDEEV